MILDNLTVLIGTITNQNALLGQNVTALGATKGVGVIDLAPLSLGGNQLQDPLRQNRLHFAVTVLEQPTSAGAATVRIALVTADDSTLTTNLQVLEQTGDIPVSVLTTGKRIAMTVNNPGLTNKRYLGATANIGTAVLTNVNPQFFGALTSAEQDPHTAGKSGYVLI